MATGNMLKGFGEDWMCGSGDIHADRWTDRHAGSSQYSAPYRAGVKTNILI